MQKSGGNEEGRSSVYHVFVSVITVHFLELRYNPIERGYAWNDMDVCARLQC